MVDQLSRGGISEFGPAAIIVIHGSEILKFDCYGDLNAHYHIATPYPRGIRNGFHGRLWWQEKTVKEQLDRTVFELIYNLKSYLATHPRRKVRNTIIDSERLASVCHQLKMRMLQDEERYGCVRRDSIEVV